MKPRIIFAFVFAFVVQTINAQTNNTPKLMLPSGHTIPVTDMALSADNEYLVSMNNKEMILWDVESQKQLWKINDDFKMRLSYYQQKSFNITNRLTFLRNKQICLLGKTYDYRTGNMLGNNCSACVYGKTNDTIETRINHTQIKLINKITNKEIEVINSSYDDIKHAVLAYHSRKLLLLTNKKLHLLDIDTKESKSFKLDFTVEDTWGVCIGFTPDDQHFFVHKRSNSSDKEPDKLMVWNIKDYSLREIENVPTSPLFSFDSKYFASFSKSMIFLYELSGFQLKDSINFEENISSVAFSKDNSKIAVAYYDKTIKVYSLSDLNKPLKTFTKNTVDATLLISYDSTKLAFCKEKDIDLKSSNIIPFKEVKSKPNPLYDQCKKQFPSVFSEYSWGESKYAIEKDKLVIWAIYKRKMIKDKLYWDFYIYRFDLKNNTKEIISKNLNERSHVYFKVSPQKKYLTWSSTPSNDKGEKQTSTLYIYDITKNKIALELKAPNKERLLGYLEIERYAVIEKNKDYKMIWDIYDIQDKKLISSYSAPNYNSSIGRVSITRNYIGLFVQSKLSLYQLKNGKIKLIQTYNVPAARFTILPDSSTIAAVNHNGGISFFRLDSDKEIASYYPLAGENWVVTTPNGNFDASKGALQYLYCTSGDQILPLESLFEKFFYPGLLQKVLYDKNTNELFTRVDSDLKPVPLVEINLIDIPQNKQEQLISKQKTVKIKVTITDQGGGIDEILLYHNNKLVQTTQRGFKKIEKNGETIAKEYTLNLTNGENTLKATAFNNQRTESIPDELKVTYNGEEKKSTLYVLAIGINEYKNNSLNLNYAIPDAEAFVGSLKTGSAQIFKNIDIHFIKNSEATKVKILEEIEKIKNAATPEDVFVFYYAGHGVMGQDIKNIKADYYLAPYDVTQLYGNEEVLIQKAISSKEIMKYSTEIEAQKQLLIMDACQSGGAIKTFASRGAAEQKAIMQLARSTGIMVLAASGSEQFATEFNELGHGAFTYALLEGMKCQADGGTKDFKITVSELKAFLEDRLPELTAKYKGTAQYPTGYSRGQDFPIVICK